MDFWEAQYRSWPQKDYVKSSASCLCYGTGTGYYMSVGQQKIEALILCFIHQVPGESLYGKDEWRQSYVQDQLSH